MKRLIGLLLIVALSFTIARAQVNTYYVATTGSNTAAGTISAPFKTITRALTVAPIGSTIYVRGGTYKERVTISKADVLVSAYQTELAIIDGGNILPGGGDIYAPLVSVSGARAVLQNFEVRNSTGRCVQLSGLNSKALGNNIHHCWDIGVYIAGSNITVENNRVWRSAESNYVHYANGNWSGGIAWGAAFSPNYSPNAIIRNNTVYQTSGEGIICMYTDGALVEGNTVYDNWAMNIYIDQCSSMTIKNNYVYYTADKQYWRNTNAPKGGITLANENYQTYPAGHDRIITGNLLVNNGANFGFWLGKLPGSGMVNDVFSNNTLVNAYETGIGIDTGVHQNSKVINNIVIQPVGNTAYVTGGSVTFSNNLWYPNNGILGAGDLRINPSLSADYRLPNNFPACTGGVNGTYMGAFPCAALPPTATNTATMTALPPTATSTPVPPTQTPIPPTAIVPTATSAMECILFPVHNVTVCLP
jgi:parallel beta-helix repeat protein